MSRPRVGVVAAGGPTDEHGGSVTEAASPGAATVESADQAVREAVEEAGADAVVAPAGELSRVELVVAHGEAALLAAARAGVSAPVLPVAVGSAVASVPLATLSSAVSRVLSGDGSVERHPVVGPSGVGPHRALLDVTLASSEPARISEFSVHRNEERIARFRADGVVVATPAGSAGYASDAGGPVLLPGTGVVSVVPVAPFATDADTWVLPVDGATLVVERDEPPVELLADGRPECTVPAGTAIDVVHLDDLETIRLPDDEVGSVDPDDGGSG